MRKLRTALTAVATASMVLATTGAAFAQGNGNAWETRADFIFQLDKALGIQPVYPATPDFQDVSPSSPYYGYIEAAYQDGITNGIAPGIFGPSLPISRAEVAKYLVIAFGAGAQASSITSTSFSDNSSIPTALVGYVGEAATLGLMKGFPGGAFEPDNNLTTVQEGYLVSHLMSSMSALTMKVTASSTDVAPGQAVTLSTSGTTTSGATVPSPVVSYSVTGTNASHALISGNTFVGSVAGNYTIQAASGKATASVTVGVYGAATSLKVNAPTSIVQNGVSTATVTVDAVDANGNIVGDNTDQVTLEDGTGAVASFGTNPSAVNAVNGVATFTLTAGTVAGASETLTATDGTMTANATLSGAAQVPTSLSVSAGSPYLSTNLSGGSDPLSTAVIDQTGNPMLTGSYTVSYAVTTGSSIAMINGAATGAGVYYGGSNPPRDATANLTDVQGQTGAITVTASATGLTSGTVNVTAVIAGAPSQIAVSAAQTVSAGTTATYTVTLEDSHGYPSAAIAAETINVTDSSGYLPTLASTYSAVVDIPMGSSSGQFTVLDTTAGTYTLTAADNAGVLTSGTSSETVTAGAATTAAITPLTTDPMFNGGTGADPNSAFTSGYLYLPYNAPTFTASVQVTDRYGNPVSQSGVAVDFYLCAGVANAGTGTLSGYGSTASSTPVATCTLGAPDLVASTNSSGVASATANVQAYSGDRYYVDAVFPSLAGGKQLYTSTLLVEQNIPATYQLAVYNGEWFLPTPAGSVVTNLTAGHNYFPELTPLDNLGNLAMYGGGDVIEVTLGGTGSVVLEGVPGLTDPVTNGPNPGQYYIDLKLRNAPVLVVPQLAGSLTVSIQDTQVYGAASQTSSYSVTPGSTVHGATFSSNGTAVTGATPLSVTAGTVYPITVTATDAGGNPIVTPGTFPFTINATGTAVGASDQYRVGSASGPNESGAYVTVDIPAGQTSATVYYIPTFTGVVSFSTTVAFVISDTASIDGVPLPAASSDLVYNVVGARTPVTLKFHFSDQYPKALGGVAVAFSSSDSAGLSTTSAVSDANGNASVTFTTPSNWSSSSPSVTVTATVVGLYRAAYLTVVIQY